MNKEDKLTRKYIRHDIDIDVSGVKIPYLTDKLPRNFQGYGIYCIYNIITHKYYIGSTNDFVDRRTTHFCLLHRGIHPNRYLQASFRKHGRKAFAFLIIEHCTLDSLIEKEQQYLDNYQPWKHEIGYNLSSKAGVGMTKNNVEALKRLSELNAKEMRVFTPEGNLIKIRNIKKFCKDKGFNYSAFLNMKRGLSNTSFGYRLFNPSLYEERDLTLQELKNIQRKEFLEFRYPTKYKFLFNNTQVVEVENLAEFAESKGLLTTVLRSLYNGVKKHPYKGYVSLKSEAIKDSQLCNLSPKGSYDYYVVDKLGVVRKMKNMKEIARFIKADNSSVCDAVAQNRGCKGFVILRELTKWGKTENDSVLL